MISAFISRASAAWLLAAGLALLFGSDAILPRVISNFPDGAAWLGQLVAAAWLAVAALNWMNRSALLGGIYSRPVVMTNAVLYFISAIVLLKIITRQDGSTGLAFFVIPIVLFTGIYGWLLFRGPFERDFEVHRLR